MGADTFTGGLVALDHLVIAARTLDEGVAWCEATLGVAPAAGGRHALMATHNRVCAIGSPAFSRCYLELIAVDPDAPPPGRARWFDLDRPALQASLARDGPQLVHWVARCDDLDRRLGALAAAGVDAGRALDASRSTPQGELRWRIAVRDDGARPCAGALPLLIEWGPLHAADALPDCGLRLESLSIAAPGAAALRAALDPLPAGVSLRAHGAPLCATLQTARGVVTLCASG